MKMPVMNQKTEKLSGNPLNASDLLRSKGIRYKAWEKWENTQSVLPRTGQKQFEPNNSWLQNKQIQKGLQDRKGLIKIERVERSSQLAVAEWLPHKNRARVTKKSGQEWMNYGAEVNAQLYLLPEETLLLVELNCLELTWNGVALSVQQAYSILLDSVTAECTIEEYRVYSKLARQGYRLQRFQYDRELFRPDHSTMKRKKIIIDPENGLKRSENPIEIDLSSEELCKEQSKSTGENDKQNGTADNIVILEDKDTPVEETQTKTSESRGEVERTVEKLIKTIVETVENNMTKPHANPSVEIVPEDVTIENDFLALKRTTASDVEESVRTGYDSKARDEVSMLEMKENDSCKSPKKPLSELYDNGVENLPGPSNVEPATTCSKDRRLKIGIISEETVLGSIKIVPDSRSVEDKRIQKWPGSRIQRNVKLMPKRNDKLPATAASLEQLNISVINIDGEGDADMADVNSKREESDGGVNKRKGCLWDADSSLPKKSRLEVIELSDDEIEEIPQRMSRMEMLNLIPNIAHNAVITEKIPRRYIPRNVTPQKNIYQYMRWKLQKPQDGKRTARQETTESNLQNNHANVNPILNGRNATRSNVSSHSNQNHNILNTLFLNMLQRPGYNMPANGNAFQNGSFSNTFRFPYSQRFSHNTLVRQTVDFRLVNRPFQTNQFNSFTQKQQVSIHVNNYTNIAFTQNILRMQIPTQLRPNPWHNQFRPNPWQNTNYFPKQNIMNLLPRPVYGRLPNYSFCRNQRGVNAQRFPSRGSSESDRMYPQQDTEVYRPSFRKIPGATSWTETKEKWMEEKTITIDDEEQNGENGVEGCEIEVVEQAVKPLVGAKNAGNLAEVYRKLQIIKSAAEKNVRQRKTEYRISYNLFPSTQSFKKASPGVPMFRLVVFRGEDSAFLQPAELNRLQQDSKDAPIMLACVSTGSIIFFQLGLISTPNI